MNVALVAVASSIAIAAVILILVAARTAADPDRRRTQARYLGAVCFLAVFVTLFGAYAVVARLSSFIVDRDNGSQHSLSGFRDAVGGGAGATYTADGTFPLIGGSGRPSDDAIWRGAVQAGLLTAAAAGILVFHRLRRRTLLATPDFTDSAASRVDTAYLYVACFLAAFVILAAAAFGTYGLFRAIAPGVARFHGGETERQRGIAQAVSLVALGLGSLVVFRMHWRGRPAPAGDTSAPPPVA